MDRQEEDNNRPQVDPAIPQTGSTRKTMASRTAGQVEDNTHQRNAIIIEDSISFQGQYKQRKRRRKALEDQTRAQARFKMEQWNGTGARRHGVGVRTCAYLRQTEPVQGESKAQIGGQSNPEGSRIEIRPSRVDREDQHGAELSPEARIPAKNPGV